jgi:hypothetical protein
VHNAAVFHDDAQGTANLCRAADGFAQCTGENDAELKLFMRVGRMMKSSSIFTYIEREAGSHMTSEM